MCAVLLSSAGCGTGEESDQLPDDRGAEAGAFQTEGKGPVTLTLTAAPARLDFSSERRAAVTIEVMSEAGVIVDVDAYEQALREGDRRFEYSVTHPAKALAELMPDGKLRWRYHYEIEFFLPGEYELPGASISFVDMRDAEDAVAAEAPPEVQELATEPVTIVVGGTAAGALAEEELASIPTLPPIELPGVWSRPWWLAPLIFLVLATAALLLVRRWRARQAGGVVVISPHEWAWRRLAALAAENLIGKGFIREFHYRVSDLVRGYIERRFAVSAQEMTTEEFLAAAAADGRIGKAITTELRRFLSDCDLVKFARHQPAQSECQDMLEKAGSLVDRTLEDTAPGPAGESCVVRDFAKRHHWENNHERETDLGRQ